jgi:FMN phosphatase YigB (HAD superfamily)
MNIEAFFVDIDGTITDYLPGSMEHDKLLGGNFLFPMIRDILVGRGMDFDEAGRDVTDAANEIIYWDYNAIANRFDISEPEVFPLFRQWHSDNMKYYHDMVETIKALSEKGKKLFIISNNPYWGCRFKLELAGLADHDSVYYFDHIFGTDIVLGCKESKQTWQNALKHLDEAPENIATIGDHFHEDGEVPQSCGIGHSFILRRSEKTKLRRENNFTFVNDARMILSEV